MRSCEKLIKRRAHFSRHLNNYSFIKFHSSCFNNFSSSVFSDVDTVTLLIIKWNSQRRFSTQKSLSGCGYPALPLVTDYRVVLSSLKTNSPQYSLVYFRNKLAFLRCVLLIISGIHQHVYYKRLSLVTVLHYSITHTQYFLLNPHHRNIRPCFSIRSPKMYVFGPPDQKWKPVGLPVGSRFFDRPVKPVEKPVKFSFLATKRHLSTNRNVLVYFIINKTFYKKSVLTNLIFRKHLLNSFKL